MGLSITTDTGGSRFLHVNDTQLSDLNGDGHIDRSDALMHFGQGAFSQASSLDGDVNFVPFADGQDALILIDTAHFPESFDLADALSNLNSIPQTLPGDYNRDEIVNAADYVVWRKALAHHSASLAADGNRNNQIDSGDYGVWRSHFGSTSAAGGAGTSSVPEPATWMIALAALGCVIASRCHRSLTRFQNVH